MIRSTGPPLPVWRLDARESRERSRAREPLIPDREAEFLLYEVADAASLCQLPAFSEYSAESFDLYLESCRRLSREELYPAYKPMDEEKPRFENGRVELHPLMHEIYPKVVELGVVSASRPFEAGGAQLPQTVATLSYLYLMAANLNVAGIVMLSTSAGHLIEAFGDDALKATFLEPMYSGRGDGDDLYQGKLRAAQYWIQTELPRVAHLSELCEAAEDSYAEMSPEWF